MTRTGRPAPRQPFAAVPALDQRWAGAATAVVDEPPTVRALGRDLVALLLLRGRRHARWLRRSVHAVVSTWARGWRCAAQVALIMLASGALAWLVWDKTETQRQEGAPSAWSAEGRLEGSLVDADVKGDLEVQRRDAPGGVGGGRSKESAGAGVSVAGGSSSSSLGGWVMSFAAVSAVLLGGAGAAVLVVRRHRRRSCVTLEQVDTRALLELSDLLLEDEPEEDAGAEDDPLLPTHGDEDKVIDVEDGWTDLLIVDGISTMPTAPPPAGSGSTDTTSSFALASGLASRGLSGGDSTLIVGEPVGSRIETRQRLYERRAAARVEYVQPGVMVWRGAQCEMTVRDLSETGLRLRVPAPSASPLPVSGDYVQVEFPVDGGQVRVMAQVAWRRTVPEGTELGVVFRPLAAEDDERIRDTCTART